MSKATIATYLALAPRMSSDISHLLRGDTGIGKSFITRRIAKMLGLPLIDKRISQMTEGDMIGLPSVAGEVTRFNPPDWVKRACREPVVIFLDEINRGTTEVMNGAFQLCLDRELNGNKLHPETRVFAAGNFGSEFTVTEMDVAFLRRFFVTDLEPTVEDWVSWAKAPASDGGGEVLDVVIDFIRHNEKFLDRDKKADPGNVQPTRASWHRLSDELKKTDLADKPTDPLFYALAGGFVGTEVAIAFVGFAKTHDAQISAEDVLLRYPKVKNKIVKLGQERWNILIDKIQTHVHKPEFKAFDDVTGPNLGLFMRDLPDELKINLWSKITQLGIDRVELAKSIHKHVVKDICGVFNVTPGEAGVGVTPRIPNVLKKS